MKKILALFAVINLTLPFLAGAQSENHKIDDKINSFISPAANAITDVIFYSVKIGPTNVPIVVVWLIIGALFFTIYFRFINLRGFLHAISITRGHYDDPANKGEVSHFQALTAALSGTVGLGNIAGVAVAISLGGPGATLWMIFAGFLGMTSKFAECTLGVKYPEIHSDGTVSGGPMYYLSKGFEKRNMKSLGTVLAIFFAIMTIGGSFGGGNMFQGNQAAEQILLITGKSDSFFGSKTFIGILMALFVGLVIIGGIKSIAKVTEKLVPLMCGIYFLAALIILIKFYDQLPHTFYLIGTGAFAPGAIYGGLLGVMIQGFKRAAFSNEAGVGSASIAHAAVKTDEPISEGLVSLLEPFIDTIIICTMTALVTVISGEYLNPNTSGIAQTSAAFAKVLPWFPYVLSIAVVLFALSTMISWSYYGLKAWTYLFGNSKASDFSYKALFIIFIIIGAAMNLNSVIDFSDAMIFAMSFPNLIGLYILAPELKADLHKYLEGIKNGTIRRHK